MARLGRLLLPFGSSALIHSAKARDASSTGSEEVLEASTVRPGEASSINGRAWNARGVSSGELLTNGHAIDAEGAFSGDARFTDRRIRDIFRG